MKLKKATHIKRKDIIFGNFRVAKKLTATIDNFMGRVTSTKSFGTDAIIYYCNPMDNIKQTKYAYYYSNSGGYSGRRIQVWVNRSSHVKVLEQTDIDLLNMQT